MNFKRRSRQWTKKRKGKEVLYARSKATHKNRIVEEEEKKEISFNKFMKFLEKPEIVAVFKRLADK